MRLRPSQASAQVEYTNGAKGDYYFCTGTVRDDAPDDKNAIIAGLRQAVTNYGATIGPHNGGLKNPNNPALVPGQYDYWHWGPDEALDVTPSGYAERQGLRASPRSPIRSRTWRGGCRASRMACAPGWGVTSMRRGRTLTTSRPNWASR